MIAVCTKSFSSLAGNFKKVKITLLCGGAAVFYKRHFSAVNTNFTEHLTRFNGVYVTVQDQEQDAATFKEDLQSALKRWKDDQRRSVLLQVPISQSHLIRVASQNGFIYHHARNNIAVLSLWLVENTDSKIPLFANHQVGVAGACFNSDKNELLVVRDKGRYSNWWKFPGGFSDLGEFVGETAVREVYEETGIEAEFKSVLSLRQMHDTIHGQSDFYFICRLQPLSFLINPCPDEIDACEWMSVDKLSKMNDATPFVKLVCKLILKGSEQGFEHVDITNNTLQHWIFKKKQMSLYHRPLI